MMTNHLEPKEVLEPWRKDQNLLEFSFPYK